MGLLTFAIQAADGRADAYIAVLAGDAVKIDDLPDPLRVGPDRGDDYLIALARASRAEVIVSGDNHLLDLADLQPRVVTPRQFIDQLA